MPIMLPPRQTELDLLEDLSRLFLVEDLASNRNRIFHCSMALLHVALSRPEIRWQKDTPAAVACTIRHIEQHYASPCHIPRLAEMVDLCTETLARSFKRHQGLTIGQFIIRVRVRRAAELLTQTDATVDQVAKQAGFPNRFYLSHVFKKITGESPAKFRQKHSSIGKSGSQEGQSRQGHLADG
jgi:transcriptional regulator GlxA family with amidase domain